MKRIALFAALALLLSCGGKEKVPTGDGEAQVAEEVPTKIPLTALAVEPAEVVMQKGGRESLSLTFTPENATEKTVAWTSSNTGVATVRDGVVTATGVGTAVITAKSAAITARCAVKVIISATALNMDRSELTLERGKREKLIAAFTPADATDALEWSSSDESVATVRDGLVYGVESGTAVIEAKSPSMSTTCTVTVVVPTTSLSLNHRQRVLYPGNTYALKASILPHDTTDEAVWTSSNSSVATVEDGVITALSKGSTTVSVQSGTLRADCSVTVDVPVAVDLGLSVRWAQNNLGAASPEASGDFYAWGETAVKERYYWDTYLQEDTPEDAASLLLGASWRLPTREEMEELRTQCSWSWTTQNGVPGYRVQGGSGSIFLPAAGYMGGSALNDAGEYGYYWTWSQRENSTQAYMLQFYNAYIGEAFFNYSNGLSIRPVSE